MLLTIVRSDDHRKFNGQVLLGESRKIDLESEEVGPVVGPNAAVMRNQGAKVSSGQWLVFCDSDCELDIPSLKSILKNASDLDAIGGYYTQGSQGWLSRVYCSIQNQWVDLGRSSDGSSADCHLLGGALAIRKEVFEGLGGFNEEIGWGGEETEFILRLIENKYISGVRSIWKVKHNNSLSWTGFLKRAWYQNFNPVRFRVQEKSFSWMASLKYFNGPFVDLPPKLLFFSVALSARSFARLYRVAV